MSSVRAASAPEAAGTRKDDKYIEISRVHLFFSTQCNEKKEYGE